MGCFSGRAETAEDDWTLAGTVMAVSDQTRTRVVAALQQAAAERNRARGKADAERAVIVDDRTAEAAVKRAYGVVLRKLRKTGDWMARTDLRSHLDSPLRQHFEAAIERLLDAGQIETREGDHGGRQYQAVEDR